jgi:hypothetical protein
MTFMNVAIALIVVGVLLWLTNKYVPMDRKIKNILNGVVVIVVLIWLLKAFGVFGPASDIDMPNVAVTPQAEETTPTEPSRIMTPEPEATVPVPAPELPPPESGPDSSMTPPAEQMPPAEASPPADGEPAPEGMSPGGTEDNGANRPDTGATTGGT